MLNRDLKHNWGSSRSLKTTGDKAYIGILKSGFSVHTLKTIMEHPYWIFYCELYLVFLFLLRFLPSFSLVIQHAKQAFYSCYCFPCRFFFAVEKVNKNDKIVLFSKIIHGIQVFHNYLVVCLKIFKKFSTAISTANVAKFGN